MSNPFTDFIEGRKNRKEKMAEEAAMKIGNDTAENEMMISDILGSVDFIHSKMDPEFLNKKSNPNQPCGDLEWAVRAIREDIMKRPVPKNIDIRKIDEKILQLANLFKQSVEVGDVSAADASKAALVKAVHNIRDRVPSDSPELSAMFIDTNAKYLDSWITLVNLCQCSDVIKRNADAEEALYKETKLKIQKSIDELWSEISESPETGRVFTEMIELDEWGRRADWSDIQVDLHTRMVERAFDKASLNLRKTRYIQLKDQYSAGRGRIDALYSKIAVQPIVTDPNLMNKFQNEIDAMIDEMAMADRDIDETLSAMEKIMGAISQFEETPGAVHSKESFIETAEDTFEEAQKQRENDKEKIRAENERRMAALGIRSQEEIQAMKEQAEKAQELAIQAMVSASDKDKNADDLRDNLLFQRN